MQKFMNHREHEEGETQEPKKKTAAADNYMIACD